VTILAPMRHENFLSFAEAANAGYAQDNVAAGRWTCDEAPARAQAEFEQLLPQGLATPDHYVYEIQGEATGEMIGFLWFAVVGKGEVHFAYLQHWCRPVISSAGACQSSTLVARTVCARSRHRGCSPERLRA